MIERVLLVAWKGSSATSWVETLKSGGYTVLLEDTTGERAWRTAKERGIDVVIIDGQKKPSHGRQTGHSLRDTAKTRNIPIIWTNLDTEDSAAVQADVKPDMTLIAPTDAVSALVALQTLHAQIAASTPTITAPEPPPPPEPVATSVTFEIVETIVAVEAAPAESPIIAAPPEPTVADVPVTRAAKKSRRVAAKQVKKTAAKKAPVKKKSVKKVAAAKRATPKKSKSPARKAAKKR